MLRFYYLHLGFFYKSLFTCEQSQMLETRHYNFKMFGIIKCGSRGIFSQINLTLTEVGIELVTPHTHKYGYYTITPPLLRSAQIRLWNATLLAEIFFGLFQINELTIEEHIKNVMNAY